MDELKKKLESVVDTYDDFIIGLIWEVRDGDIDRDELVSYIDQHPEATTSDIILEFVKPDEHSNDEDADEEEDE